MNIINTYDQETIDSTIATLIALRICILTPWGVQTRGMQAGLGVIWCRDGDLEEEFPWALTTDACVIDDELRLGETADHESVEELIVFHKLGSPALQTYCALGGDFLNWEPEINRRLWIASYRDEVFVITRDPIKANQLAAAVRFDPAMDPIALARKDIERGATGVAAIDPNQGGLAL
jgi:hypothetical protein